MKKEVIRVAASQKKKGEKNPHAGHRERMRQKVRRNGFSDFAEHEILEYMLFHVIRRGNTNEIGHALLDTFGSVGEVFRASYEELIRVPGVGPACADYIVFLREMYRALEDCRSEGASMKTKEERCEYFLHKLSLETDENLLVACLDDDLHVRHLFLAMKGTPESVRVDLRILAQRVLYSHCNNIVLAHNHPKGKPMPSYEDIHLTTAVSEMLDMLSIHVIDHIIVADGKAVSMLALGAYSPPHF